MLLYYMASYAYVGILVFGLVVAMHLLHAEKQGYEAFDYWEVAFQEIESKLTWKQLVWSVAIWPVRVIQFVGLVGVFYDIYDYKKYGPRTRKGWL